MVRKSFSGIIVLALSIFMAGFALSGCSQTPEAEETNTEAQMESSPDSRAYTVVHVESDTEEIDWKDIPQLDIDNVQWIDATGISAHAQLCYDDDTLHVHMWAEEPDIRAEYQKSDLLPKTYEDSCLEFFIMPVPDDNRYLNFEINPNCAMLGQIGIEKTGRINLIPSDDDTFNAVSSRGDGGWEVSYDLPFEYIKTLYPDFSVESGTELRANFYKCGNLTAQKHYLSWNPIDSENPNFHVPECFGTLVFE